MQPEIKIMFYWTKQALLFKQNSCSWHPGAAVHTLRVTYRVGGISNRPCMEVLPS